MISKEEYTEKKQKLINELSDAKKNGNVALGKNTSNLFRHRKQTNTKRIDVRHFNNVISIDEENLIVEVEGMTTYEELVDETLKYGFMPAVVPQLKSITIGGAVTGVGIESSSFKYGLVHETITEIEVMLSSGDVVVCTKENENKDLFFGFPNSYGTLGYILKLKTMLVPVKKYVHVKHLKYDNSSKYFDDIEKLCNEKKVDFIDGTVFNEKEMYITTGEFVDKAPYTSKYDFLEIYYKTIMTRKEDFLTTKDYIWRWDTDWFWCSKHFFVQNKLMRLLFGKKRLGSVTYSKIRRFVGGHKFISNLMQFIKRTESVIQDIEIPIKSCPDFIEFFHKEIRIKPVWICPTSPYDKNSEYSLYLMEYGKLYINFGFWDTIESNKEDGYYNKKIESKVSSLGGKKSLYSDSYYTENEFWDLYNKNKYDVLKNKHDPKKIFSDLYSKTVLGK
jgi:FAD/FMN-containing dehydrogenase